jgi:tetrahydromethanopterin S-methyltransferase subunit G
MESDHDESERSMDTTEEMDELQRQLDDLTEQVRLLNAEVLELLEQ